MEAIKQVIEMIDQITSTNNSPGNVHSKVIELIQAHGEGKSIQVKNSRNWSDHDWEDVEGDLFNLLNRISLTKGLPRTEWRVNPAPEWRPWHKDEVPEIAVYRHKNGGHVFVKQNHDIVTHLKILQTFFENYEVSYDSGKTWNTCGVEI